MIFSVETLFMLLPFSDGTPTICPFTFASLSQCNSKKCSHRTPVIGASAKGLAPLRCSTSRGIHAKGSTPFSV